MAWTITHQPEANRIDIILEGEIPPEILRQVTHSALDLVAERRCLGVLVDCRKLYPAPLPSAVQRLPEIYAAREADHRMRIAVVLSGNDRGLEVSHFYKMAARRRDYTVQLFEELDEAHEWLMQEAGTG